MNLILCGFQGVGKTTLGRALAKKVGTLFYDTDELILQARGDGMPCAQIVEQEGEGAFRALESQVIVRLQGVKRTVIALGGGALDREENRTLVASLGQIVYLETDFATAQAHSRLAFTPFEALYKKRVKLFESLATHRIPCDEEAEKRLEHIWQEISLEPSLKS